MPGWYGMENGQKPEMGKKMEIEKENGPKLERGKNGKKNGPKIENHGKLPQKIHSLSIFLPFLPLSSLGPFSISMSIVFSPFPAFGHFPCHASPT